MNGVHLSGFFAPGGNGLPELYIHPNDPPDWVMMQLAARSPGNQANVPTTKDVAETAAVGAVATVVPDWAQRLFDSLTSKLPNPKDYFKGAAVAGVLLLVAVGFILLGAYNLTKD